MGRAQIWYVSSSLQLESSRVSTAHAQRVVLVCYWLVPNLKFTVPYCP